MRIGQRTFDDPGPFLMGILNVTPDSFSDGGRYLLQESAVRQGLRMAAEGADLIDVGGESTRPGAPAVPWEEERDRVVPVIEALKKRGLTVPISVDTRRPQVAAAALRAGAALVNDVSGLSHPAMLHLLAETGAPAVLMHMRGSPADMQEHARYGDVVAEVAAELEAALVAAERAGVARDRLILDPGIGFAKTAEQSLTLLRQVSELRRLGRPLMVGPSRKSFIGTVTGAPAEERLPGTLAALTASVLAGVEWIRVHDVAAARQAAAVARAIRDAGTTSTA
jgi:dihydropteroate synthase